MIARALVIAFALALSAPAAADEPRTFEGKCVRVLDGDTIDVLIDGHDQQRVRLFGIDSPETRHGQDKPGQPYSQVARRTLGELVKGKQVTVVDRGRSYGRIVGSVTTTGADGQTLDVELEMLRRGLAWHYKRFDASA